MLQQAVSRRSPGWPAALQAVAVAPRRRPDFNLHPPLPPQTLGKCAKMIPVMIWGTIIMRKRYGAQQAQRSMHGVLLLVWARR